MNRSEVRRAWLEMCGEANRQALEERNVQDALYVMAERYESLVEEERDIVDDLLTEQLESKCESVRFDSLFLIRKFDVRSAVPALRKLAAWLESQHSPGAPYEWAKVGRIIAQLTTRETLE